jgi:hypothetical protein
MATLRNWQRATARSLPLWTRGFPGPFSFRRFLIEGRRHNNSQTLQTPQEAPTAEPEWLYPGSKMPSGLFLKK